MSKESLSPREQSLELLRQALKTGIRGRNKEAIQAALDIIEIDGRGGLSDLNYRNLAVGKTLTDPERPGLWMRRNKNSALWLYNFKSPVSGKTKAHEFGTYPATSLLLAREKYEKFQSAVDEGRDPFIESAESGITVKTLCKKYIDEYAVGPDVNNPRKRSWKEDRRVLNYDLLAYRGEGEGWSDRPVISITDSDVEDLLDGIIEDGSPRSAEKLLVVARKMWVEAIRRNRKKGKRAAQQRWVPGLTTNPWANVELEKRETSTAYLNETQIRSFLCGLHETNMEAIYKDALLLQFLTVARVGEVAGATWDEIDLDNKIWNLPAERSKNGQPHRILLSQQAVNLLERREKEATSKYVFPSVNTSGHVVPTLVARHLAKNRELLKLPETFSTHGLRHTALTQIAILKYGKHIRDRISNHKDSSVDSIYQHYEYDEEARECWQAWADRLDALSADKVTPLRRIK